jgi:uncharacterized protein YbjT (DUF2867 family)
MSTYLVVGANGTVGQELARVLEGAGHTVRRGSSRPDAVGTVHLDLVRGEGIEDALRGVDGAFVMAPAGYTNQDVLLDPVFAIAARLGVPKVILMSAMGADAGDETPLRKAELLLERSGVTWNVIRPNWFMQNFHTYWLQGIVSQGAILLPVGDAKTSFIDARDIADVAAALLQRGDFNNRAFDLTGDESLTHAEVAVLLSEALGRPIRFEDVTPDTLRPMLLAAGLPSDYAEFLLVILSYLKAGYAERITDAVPSILGRAPRGFAEYARDYREAYPKLVRAVQASE